MIEAITYAKKGIDGGQSPFGSVIVKGGEIISAAHNTVWKTCDPTAHAEVNAIRLASQNLKTIDLSGTTLYTTCEPCPMCLTAIHWAKIDVCHFGATIDDAKDAGFAELEIAAVEMVERGKSPLKVRGGLMQKECATLFQDWMNAGKGKSY